MRYPLDSGGQRPRPALRAAPSMSPARFTPLRREALDRLPGDVQSLALVWSRPFAVGCMSITTAMAAGYRAAFCEPGCGATERESAVRRGRVAAGRHRRLAAGDADADGGSRAGAALIERGVRRRRHGRRAARCTWCGRPIATATCGRRTYPDRRGRARVAARHRRARRAASGAMPDAIGYFTGAAQSRS